MPSQMKKVSAAQAKAHLSALMAEVAYGGEHVIIERRGKPLAALVSIADLERLDQGQAISARARGALALVGAWRLDQLVAEIYARRQQDTGRPVELEA